MSAPPDFDSEARRISQGVHSDWKDLGAAWRGLDVLHIREALEAAHASGRRAGLLEAAEVARTRHAETQALLAKGKGEWPTVTYVNDQTWAWWQGEEMATRRLADALRALADEVKT